METMLMFYGAGAVIAAGYGSYLSRNLDPDSQKFIMVGFGIAGFAITKALFELIAMAVTIGIGAKVYATFKKQIDQMAGNLFEGRQPGKRMDDQSDLIDRLKEMGMSDDDVAEWLKEN